MTRVLYITSLAPSRVRLQNLVTHGSHVCDHDNSVLPWQQCVTMTTTLVLPRQHHVSYHDNNTCVTVTTTLVHDNNPCAWQQPEPLCYHDNSVLLWKQPLCYHDNDPFARQQHVCYHDNNTRVTMPTTRVLPWQQHVCYQYHDNNPCHYNTACGRYDVINTIYQPLRGNEKSNNNSPTCATPPITTPPRVQWLRAGLIDVSC